MEVEQKVIKEINKKFAFHELKWDTEFFGVSCAKVVINEKLDILEWNELKREFHKYQFISIENRNSNPANAWYIGKYFNAFLADVNIQFIKKINVNSTSPDSVKIYQAMKREDQIIEMTDFHFSKFLADPELAKRGGEKVYQQWVMNAFNKSDKYFAVIHENEIEGFLLHSYSDEVCKIELIAVSTNIRKSGIGTKLFNAVESAAIAKGCKEIHVGTQLRNLSAINFYTKLGCKQVGSHQVYHMWNN